jgi:hypothetical protein
VASAFQFGAFQPNAFQIAAVNGTANGQTLVVNASIIPGAVTVTDEFLIQTGSRGRFEPVRVDGQARGVRLIVRASLLPGKASADALAPGVFLQDANAKPSIVVAFASLEPGQAFGEINLSDEEILMLLAEAA